MNYNHSYDIRQVRRPARVVARLLRGAQPINYDNIEEMRKRATISRTSDINSTFHTDIAYDMA